MVAWTLVFHIIGLVFWVGSLLAATHVLAIHTEETSPEARAALGRLEMKLLKCLTHPGAAIMLITGIALLAQDQFALRAHWLHFKLVLVVVMIALDLRVYSRAKAFNTGAIELRRGECMALHGIIALILMGILILVLVKPFGQPVRGANSLGLSPVPSCVRAGSDRRYSVQPPESAAIIEEGNFG